MFGMFDKGCYSYMASVSTVTQDLPTGVYVVKFRNKGSFYYLEETEKFKLPNKMYGGIHKQKARIFKTYDNKISSMGVLLQGDVGLGKSLLLKEIGNEFVNQRK